MTPELESEEEGGRAVGRRRASRKARLCAWGFAFVFGLVLLEIGARVAAGMGLVTISHFETENGTKQLDFVADISEVTGVWHLPNASVEVHTPSGLVTYDTNTHGMRDRPRENASDASSRILVLGDSFVEGWMVATEHRFTDVLEGDLGIEFLNFGCSGDFGTIQQWLLYRDLASEFAHSDVALFFLPDNDFKDNDPARNSARRYRPYLRVPQLNVAGEAVEDGEPFEVYYPRKFKPVTTKRIQMSAGKRFRHQLYNRSYFCNLLSNINFHADSQSAYTGFSAEDWDRVEYSLAQLARAVGPSRRLTIFVIPRSDDLRAVEESDAGPSIVDKLTGWAAARSQPGTGASVRVVDLKPGFESWLQADGNKLMSLFIPGDGHWNQLGHEVASSIIAPYYREESAP